MNKHTPGPWSIRRSRKGQSIVEIGPICADEYAGSCWLDVSEADASLAVSAPELLEALELLSKSAPSACCVDFHHQPGDYHGADESCPALDRYESACLSARAAIAKARGQS